jgi:hypothetical protein
MREIRLYGSEGGGAAALPTPIIQAIFIGARNTAGVRGVM